MIALALFLTMSSLMGLAFVAGVAYARRYPPPVYEPAPALSLPVRRKPTTLRLVQRPFDQDRCARAPFTVVPSEDAL